MTDFTITKISEVVSGKLFPRTDFTDLIINQIAIDSRTVFKGENTAFFALVGLRNNGHSYIVDLINMALPQVSAVLIAILMLLLMIGIWGGELNWVGGSPAGWIVAFSAAVVFIIFGSSAGWFLEGGISWLSFLWEEDIKALLVIILVFGIIIWFVTKEPSSTKEKASGVDKWHEAWGKMFGGGK